MKRLISAIVALVVIVANIGAAYAATDGGFPSTPRLQGLFIGGTRVYPLLWAVKTTTEQRANTVTIADDAELTINLEASKHYLVKVVLKWCGSSVGTMGYRFRVVAPGGVDTPSSIGTAYASTVGTPSGPVEQATINASDATAATISVCNAVDQYIKEGIILTSSAGVLKVQWAQNSTSASNLNLFRGSYISALKLN